MDIYEGGLDVENYNNNMISEEEMELRRGPWTVEEDLALMNYIAQHGEGRWNSLARSAGLKRTGKSCRLRWLNYLRPDVRRGNITLEEQLLILELHSRWGNRWSKIAQHLPGRTDNEIKNYWRTRVQKHAKQLKCDVNSKRFKDAMRYLWMPRLVERIQAAAAATAGGARASSSTTSSATTTNTTAQHQLKTHDHNSIMGASNQQDNNNITPNMVGSNYCTTGGMPVATSYAAENSSTATASSDSFGTPVSDLTDCYNYPANQSNNQLGYGETLTSPTGYYNQLGLDFTGMEQNSGEQWIDEGNMYDNLWNVDDIMLLQQQFNL